MSSLILLLVLVVVVFIIRQIRVTILSMVPPARIRLLPGAMPGDKRKLVESHERALTQLGFRPLGTYRVDPMRGVHLQAFAHRGESVCAIVYVHPLAGCFVDLVSRNEAGRSLTVTTAPAGRELDQREEHEKIFEKNLPISEMFNLLLGRRPAGPHESWNESNFVSKFQDAYAREMDWRAGRGGVTSDEVRRHAHASGRKFSDGDILKATHTLQRKFAETRRDAR